MTERFTLTNPKNAFQEMKCGIDDRGNTLTFNEVVDMLNAFNDENEQLKSICQDYRDHAIDFKADCVRLEKENEQLKSEIEKLSYTNEDLLEEKRIWKQMSDEYTKLSDENGQLKNKIDVLEDDNETYHKSLEKLNLYTKRFIPTKCTNEFKDCKTNRYYWLDHEGNFKGCLELLNLLDCENEVLKSENRQLKGRLMEYEEQIKGDME